MAKYLYAFVKDEMEESADTVEEAEALVIISASAWEERREWDDRDPFQEICDDFGLDPAMECWYEPYTSTLAEAVEKLEASGIARFDPSILVGFEE